MNTRYFITGGAGFVGSHTVDQLVSLGEEVTVYDSKPWEDAHNLHHQENTIRYVEGDICDFEHLKKAMMGHGRILHLAALVSVTQSVEDPRATHDVNVSGTLNVFEAARENGCARVVYASSAAVYGEQSVVPIQESASLKPLSPYGLHKIMNEEYASLYSNIFGLSTMGLRYFNIFGERQDPSSSYSGVISVFTDRLNKGERITIYGDGSATRDFVHVDNIVSANLKALDSNRVGVCNIGTGQETSLLELVETLARLKGAPVDPIFKDTRQGDIVRSCPSVNEAKEVLGYTVVREFEDGLRSLVT